MVHRVVEENGGKVQEGSKYELTMLVARLCAWGRNSGTSAEGVNDQSGAAGLYVGFFENPPVTSWLLPAPTGQKIGMCLHPSPSSALPGLNPLGLNGAALAALGDNPALLVAVPLTARDGLFWEAGVKLGESTFNLFFILCRSDVSK